MGTSEKCVGPLENVWCVAKITTENVGKNPLVLTVTKVTELLIKKDVFYMSIT